MLSIATIGAENMQSSRTNTLPLKWLHELHYNLCLAFLVGIYLYLGSGRNTPEAIVCLQTLNSKWTTFRRIQMQRTALPIRQYGFKDNIYYIVSANIVSNN